MSFFWNDETFWDRIRAQNKIFVKIYIPLFIVCAIVLIISIFEKVKISELLLLTLLISLWFFTFINMFLRLPHFRIPDTYPKWGGVLIYILDFLLVSIGLYMISVAMLYSHYPFFEQLVCCDWIKSLKF